MKEYNKLFEYASISTSAVKVKHDAILPAQQCTIFCIRSDQLSTDNVFLALNNVLPCSSAVLHVLVSFIWIK